MQYKAVIPTPTNRVKKLLERLSKEADKQGYDYFLLAFPRPGENQQTMSAECAFRVKSHPGNMGSLLSTLKHQHGTVKAVFAAMEQIEALKTTAKKEDPPASKLIL